MDGLVHGISTRRFGSIKSNGQINRENLRNFLEVLGIDIKRTVFPKQVHGSGVVTINDSQKNYIMNFAVVIPTSVEGSHTTSFGERDSSTEFTLSEAEVLGMTGGAKLKYILKADGLITNKKNVFLGIVTADCLPVIFYDKKMGIVGIAHAGYKGLLRGIIQEMIKGMKKIGSDLKNMKIAIGPAIGLCCYDVPIERAEVFENAFKGIKTYEKRNGKYFLDLKSITRQILISEGIRKKNIEVSQMCTKDNLNDFFSFRGEGQKFGEFVTVIGRKTGFYSSSDRVRRGSREVYNDSSRLRSAMQNYARTI